MSTELLAPIPIPESTEIKTGAYVIPANKYARVTCLEAYDSDFTVNGVVAEKARLFKAFSSFSSGAAFNVTLPAGYLWEVRFFIGQVSNNSFRVYLYTTVDNTNFPLINFDRADNSAGVGSSVSDLVSTPSGNNNVVNSKGFVHEGGQPVRFSGAGYQNLYFLAKLIKQGEDYSEIVAPGTSLNGDRYSVSLYPIPKNNLPLALQE